jgi:hypothetical protein
MATSAAVNQVYLVTLVGRLDDQLIMTTNHYQLINLVGGPLVGDIYDQFNVALNMLDQYIDRYLDCCPTNYTCDEMWVQLVAPIRVRKGAYVIDRPGSSTYTALTANVAQVVERFGETAGRGAVGGVHLPSPTDVAWITGGELTVAALTKLNLFAPKLFQSVGDGVTDSRLYPCLYNRLFPEEVQERVIGVQVQPTVRVMRRRTVGVGK